MAMIKSSSADISARTAYHQVRRAQGLIASYRNFQAGDLAQYLERDTFNQMADRLSSHYFLRSKGLLIFEQVKELYLSLLVLAPVLQRLPLSYKFDWHRGHLLSFLRIQSGGRIGRHHVAVRHVERIYAPDQLATNMAELGIHDAVMTAVVRDIYRRHACGKTLKDKLANQLFDPMLMIKERYGFEFRFANQLIRMEKEPFAGSTDLRRDRLTLLDFEVKSVVHRGRRALEILVSDDYVRQFRTQVDSILNSRSDPEYKLLVVDNIMRDFIERTRSARSGLNQMQELKVWLTNSLRRLSATLPAAKELPNRFINLWLQRVDSRLHLKKPNFFLDPYDVPENTYRTFFSPFREV